LSERPSRYELTVGWFASGSPLTRPALAVVVLSALAAVGMIALVFATSARNAVGAAVILAGCFALFLAWAILLRDLLIRVHHWLLPKDWSDGRKLAIYFGVGFGFLLATFAAGAVLVSAN
jgi:hypothetical protein